MKKSLIIFSLIFILCISGVFTVHANYNKGISSKSNSIAADKWKASITNIKGIKELKNASTTIIEAVASGEIERRDYNGLPAVISKLHVRAVFKGDKRLNTIKLFQIDKFDKALIPNRRFILFLKEGADNPDCYVVIGGTSQGIYEIEDHGDANIIVPFDDTVKNEALIKDLQGNYENVKDKLLDK